MMNNQNNFRNLWIAILSLFMLNIGTLGWIFFKNKHEGPPPVGPVFIEKTLGFDKKQLEEFEPLKKQHFKDVLPVREEIKKDKDALFTWVKSEKGDSTELENHLASLSLKVIQNERNTFKHFRELRDLCTPEQKEIFDKILIDRFRKMPPEKAK
jgi:periplasmic protein CpxP/Spy